MSEKLAGHSAARKVGDMRVGPVQGDYPGKIDPAEAESPWESYCPSAEQKTPITISGLLFINFIMF